jgi:hypothetical protein
VVRLVDIEQILVILKLSTEVQRRNIVITFVFVKLESLSNRHDNISGVKLDVQPKANLIGEQAIADLAHDLEDLSVV